jgi:hypothetical protein
VSVRGSERKADLLVVDARRRRRWLVALLVFWCVGVVVFGAHLVIGAVSGDLGCESPQGSSNYGSASWQWWYPGTRCSYEADQLNPPYGHVAAHVDRPGFYSGAAAIVLIGAPVVTLIAFTLRAGVRTRRRRRITAAVE